jgi:uncharacterized protein
MRFETAKKSIKLLYDSADKNGYNSVVIGFIGGEPLLEFKLITKIVDYSKEIFKSTIKIKWSILTNGTLLNDEIVKFLKNNNFKVIVSIDGNEKTHNLHRKFVNGKGSYQKTKNNILKYKNEFKITSRSTITNENFNINEIITHLLSIGIKNFSIGYDCNITSDTINKFANSYTKLMDTYFNDISNGNFYTIDNVKTYIYYIVGRFRNCSNCNAGIAYKAVSSSGNLYLCHRFVGNENLSFSNVNTLNQNDLEEQNKLFTKQRNVDVGLRIKSCKDCSFKYLCGGPCYHHSYQLNKNIFSETNVDCQMKQIFIKNVLHLLVKMPIELRREYLLFLSHC